MTPFEISVRFFLQIAFILGACRLVGWLGTKIGQPQVVGEMVAGVIIGPSVFGAILPDAQAWMFPSESRPIIFSVSQIGLAVYMFIIGVEFDWSLIKSRLRSAAAVSLSGILTPFALGAAAAYFLKDRWPLFAQETSTLEAMLFMGAAMSITAFPMLARIIFERGLAGTSLGTLALAAGSIDDAAAWCVLAIVLASFAGNASIALLAIGGGILYVLFVAVAIRPLFRRIAEYTEKRGELTHPILGLTFTLVMLGSWFTDVIGIYAVFGAFILGVAVPKGYFADQIRQHVEKMTTSFLLPLFFIYSGLNTKIGLINSPDLLGITLLLLFLAIAGKGLACYLAALAHGEPQRDALAIGTLMNARGLMELIILNIGLEHGVITPTLFTMMVLMAIVTTLMAAPAFNFWTSRRDSVNKPQRRRTPIS